MARLRRFLIGLAGLIFLVTPVELIASDHTRTPTQWIPYGLCGLGLLCAAVIWRAPSMRAGRMVRAASGPTPIRQRGRDAQASADHSLCKGHAMNLRLTRIAVACGFAVALVAATASCSFAPRAHEDQAQAASAW